MKKRAILVSNISKRFKIYKSPKDRLKEAISLTKHQYHKEFWALKGVSFSLEKGTTMGILGINGSGKSTLLKIICGYLLPTGGGVRAEGRISSILELGTGFNRDFTGRENVILYGGLMGLSKGLIAEKMPKVEKFADIEVVCPEVLAPGREAVGLIDDEAVDDATPDNPDDAVGAQ